MSHSCQHLGSASRFRLWWLLWKSAIRDSLPSDLTDLREARLKAFFPLDPRSIVPRVWTEDTFPFSTQHDLLCCCTKSCTRTDFYICPPTYRPGFPICCFHASINGFKWLVHLLKLCKSNFEVLVHTETHTNEFMSSDIDNVIVLLQYLQFLGLASTFQKCSSVIRFLKSPPKKHWFR